METFDSFWRSELRSGRCAALRHRICQLRRSIRNRASALEPWPSGTAIHLFQTLSLKGLEALLFLVKCRLKIRGV